MERWTLERAAIPSLVDYHASIQMIGAIGSRDMGAFAKSALSVARNYARVRHCTVFAFLSHRNPQLVSAASMADSPIARDTAAPYIEHFFKKDEIQNIIVRGAGNPINGNVVVHRQSLGDIADSDYRITCYSGVNIGERIATLIRVRHDTWISLNLYRDATDGPFLEPDVEAICNLSTLFAHTAARHYSLDEGGHAEFNESIADDLSAHADKLTAREREVVLRILDGQTTKVIARDLSIGPSTVVTYRERAYEKLGVSCRAELFAAILRRRIGQRRRT